MAQTAYTFRQLEEIWVAAGGSRIEAAYMAAIALAESGGNPHAENHNKNGSIDRGLWQINSVHGKQSTFNVAENARAAVAIRKKEGLKAWSTYNNGAYTQFLTKKNLLSGIKQNESIESLAGLAGILEGKIPGVSKEGKGEKQATEALEKTKTPWQGLEEFIDALAEPHTWVRMVEVIGGLVLVYIGIHSMVEATRPTVVGEAAGEVNKATLKLKSVAGGAAGVAAKSAEKAVAGKKRVSAGKAAHSRSLKFGGSSAEARRAAIRAANTKS